MAGDVIPILTPREIFAVKSALKIARQVAVESRERDLANLYSDTYDNLVIYEQRAKEWRESGNKIKIVRREPLLDDWLN